MANNNPPSLTTGLVDISWGTTSNGRVQGQGESSPLSSFVDSLTQKIQTIIIPSFLSSLELEMQKIADNINKGLREGKGLGGKAFAAYSPATLSIKRSQGRTTVGKPLSGMAGSVVLNKATEAARPVLEGGGRGGRGSGRGATELQLEATNPWSELHNTGNKRVSVFGSRGKVGFLPQRKFFPTTGADSRQVLPQQKVLNLWSVAWQRAVGQG